MLDDALVVQIIVLKLLNKCGYIGDYQPRITFEMMTETANYKKAKQIVENLQQPCA